MMQSFKVLAILVSFLCQAEPKAVNKESSHTLGQDYGVKYSQQKFPSNYERAQKLKTFNPMIDGKPIIIPKTYLERKGLEATDVERELSLEGTKYELDDSINSEALIGLHPTYKTSHPMIDGKHIIIPKTYLERKGLKATDVGRELSLESTKYKNSEALLGLHPTYKTSRPMIDGKHIIIPKTYLERKGLEATDVGRELRIKGTKYELDDSKNSEALLNDDSQDSSFDNDEVFVFDRRKSSKTSNSKSEKSPNTGICATGLKATSNHDEYTKDCSSYKNANDKSKETMISDEKQKHLKSKNTEIVNMVNSPNLLVKDESILSDITQNGEGLNHALDLKSSKDKPLNLDQDNKGKQFELLTDISDDEHLPLQEEVRNMFSPSFKSFVFNPVAKNQAKFQECKTSKNESGNCRYVQHCFLPSILSSVDQFMNNVCIIESRFIGVCCPEFPVSKLAVNWKNKLENIEGSNDPAKTPAECGIGTNTRIVGGTDANLKAWPWMVALLNNRKKFFCGGSLINDRYVLTAAHCTFGTRNDQIIARLGEFDLSSDEGVHEDYMVDEIKRHGQYNSLTLRNDIALLKLHKPVVFNEFVKTICLPNPNKTYTDEMATLTGWGHIQGGISAFTSDKLQEASFPIETNEECSLTHGITVPPSLICTAAPTKDKGACNGDSGGPLMLLDDEDRWKVIGIVSWGRRGCNTKYPSVFTRVTHYLGWIKEHAV